MSTLSDALQSLCPNSIYRIPGNEEIYENIIWHEANAVPLPDKASLLAEVDRLQAIEDATQYQRDRQPEYPDLAVLADALYWSNQGDNTKLDEYYAACSAVKAKYPKP